VHTSKPRVRNDSDSRNRTTTNKVRSNENEAHDSLPHRPDGSRSLGSGFRRLSVRQSVAFGAYDPVVANAATDLTAAGSVNVACTKGTPATIDLGNGGNLSGGSRRMASGSDFLNYALYKDAARTQVWGTGLAGGTTMAYNAATKASTAVSVYGTVPQNQDVTVGAYSDVVLATINY